MTLFTETPYQGLSQDPIRSYVCYERSANDLLRWSDAGGHHHEPRLDEQDEATAETFARSARKQQEGFRIIAEGWSDAYEGFVISPFDYAQEGIRISSVPLSRV